MKRSHLVIRLSSLGDICLCSAFCLELLDRYPNDQIIFICHENYADFVKNSFHKNIKVIALPKAKDLSEYDLHLENSLKHKLNQSWSLYDLHLNRRSKSLVTALQKLNPQASSLDVKKTHKAQFKRWLAVLCKIKLKRDRFIYQEHLQLINSKSLHTPKLRQHKELSSKENKILIAVDTQHRKKNWPAEQWQEFLTIVASRNPQWKLTFVGINKSFCALDLDKMIQEKNLAWTNLVAKTKLNQIAEIAASHRLCLSSNSAWLHIAEAVGTPVLELAGPIIKEFGFSPWKKESQRLAQSKLWCRPCTRHGAGYCHRLGSKKYACMKELKPALVHQKIAEMLRS